VQLELKEYDTVRVKLSFVDSAIKVTLLAAETNGLWIHAHELRSCGAIRDEGARSGTADAVFLPFAQVEYVLKDLSASS